MNASAELFRAIAHSLPDSAVFTYGTDELVQVADGPALAGMALVAEQVVGKDIASLLPAEAAARLRLAQRAALVGASSRFELGFAGRLYDVRTVPVTADDGRVLAGMTLMHDVTERVQAFRLLEERLGQPTRELSALLTVSRNVASTTELAPLLSAILDHLQAVVQYSSAVIYLPDGAQRGGREWRAPAAVALLDELPLAQWVERVSQEWAQRRRPLIVDDLQAEQSPQGGEATTAVGRLDFLRSLLGVPIIINESVAGILALSHSQPGYYTQQHAALALAVANQAAVALENAMLNEQAHRLAVLEERQRLAHELHDSVTQSLYSMNLYADAANRALASGKRELVADHLRILGTTAQDAMRDMRLLIFELHPPVLEEEGLVGAIEARLSAVEARAGLHTEFHVEGERTLPLTIAEELYRVVQELLSNVLKHSRAAGVTVDLRFEPERVTLDVVDDGVGFDVAAARRTGGMGLHGIEERVARAGGRLQVESSPGQSTRARVELAMPDVGPDGDGQAAGVPPPGGDRRPEGGADG